MKLHKQGWAFMAAVALVVGLSSTALAIEAFQERFEWGDMSKPTTLQGRVIILDPYDEAVWINIAVFGGNAESGLFWQKIHPGKNLKFYAADKAVWEQLKSMARPHAGPAAAKEVPPSSQTTLVEFTAQETEQNHRVISAVKKLSDNAGELGKPKSISSLRLKECDGKNEMEAGCAAAKQVLNTSPKSPDGANVMMQYDVLQPGGKPLSGLIPWSAKYNQPGGHH
ncbi:MAG: hypothetical protein KF814_12425 [Nitrospiraceae bacterium]|nr:hypothetical protein [Nitrospiraceae bacterium]